MTRVTAILLCVGLLSACEGAPARSKPWRHKKTVEPAQGESELANVVAENRVRAEAQRERGHTLRIHVGEDPRHLNPLERPTVWGQRIVSDTVFETLFRYQPGDDYEPELAERWVWFPGGREVRIVLNSQARFSNGRKVSALDVQFSIDSARTSRRKADHLRHALADIASVELVNPRVVRIRLSRANSYVKRALAEVPILPSSVYYGKLGIRADFPVVGSGPYRVDEVSKERIVLVRRDDYWRKAPAIPRIVFAIEPDHAAALTAARAADFDIVPEIKSDYYPAQTEAPSIVRQFSPLRLAPASARLAILNTNRAPLLDRRVREALSLLIDREQLAKRIHAGLARPIGPPIWHHGPAHGTETEIPEHDPERAVALLDRAGYVRDGSGVRRNNGRRLEITVLATEGENRERDAILQAFKRTGIATDLRIGSPAVLRNRMRSGSFDLAFVEWRGFSDRDIAALLETGGKRNYGGYASSAADKHLAAARHADTPSERAEALSELAIVLAREVPVIGLFAPSPYGLIHKRVRGLEFENGWIRLRDLSLSDDS